MHHDTTNLRVENQFYHGRIEGFVHDATEFQAIKRAVRVNLLWVDHENRLFLEDNRSGFPVIRVVKLEE